MAQYNVKHSCGHEVTHRIVGTNVNNERFKKIEWLEGLPCIECKCTEQADGLPALKGSKKQIAWAISIRSDAVKSIDNALDQIRKSGREILPQISAAVEALKAQTSAAWWIDHKYAGRNCRTWAGIAGKLCVAA